MGKGRLAGLWALLRFLRGRESGVSLKVLAVLALAYLVIPSDLIPDLVPFAGWIDDLGVIAAVLAFVTNRYRSYRQKHPPQEPPDSPTPR